MLFSLWMIHPVHCIRELSVIPGMFVSYKWYRTTGLTNQSVPSKMYWHALLGWSVLVHSTRNRLIGLSTNVLRVLLCFAHSLFCIEPSPLSFKLLCSTTLRSLEIPNLWYFKKPWIWNIKFSVANHIPAWLKLWLVFLWIYIWWLAGSNCIEIAVFWYYIEKSLFLWPSMLYHR